MFKKGEYVPCVTPRAGWAEQDVGVYWNALKTAVAGLKNNALLNLKILREWVSPVCGQPNLVLPELKEPNRAKKALIP